MISYLNEVGEHVTDGAVIKLVCRTPGTVPVSRFMHGTLIRKLSGGEKRRLYLLKLLMGQPNVLLLDEPTNDLDIGTLTVLENYIDHFNGTVITVSHDRYFLDKVADRLLVFNGNGQIDEEVGFFTDYLVSLHTNNTSKSEKSQPKTDKPKVEVKKEKTKLTYAEKKEWETIEAEIDKLEANKSDLKEQMNQNGANYDKLAELQAAVEQADKDLDAKIARWEYLSDYAE